MDGLLLVDKPAGPTSHDVIAKIKKICRPSRIGHTGTLDPFATGLLVVCFGKATKIISYLPENKKVYLAGLVLGKETDTHDYTGEVTRVVDDFTCDRETLHIKLREIQKTTSQIPPYYSAIKVKGEPLYKKARRGELIDVPARAVEIEEISLLNPQKDIYCSGDILHLRITCSRGTYIRSIARDLGKALGCGAYLNSLRRTASGPFSIENALPLSKIQEYHENFTLEEYMIDLTTALSHLNKIIVGRHEQNLLVQGRPLLIEEEAPGIKTGITVAVNRENELIALVTAKGNKWFPFKVFLPGKEERG